MERKISDRIITKLENVSKHIKEWDATNNKDISDKDIEGLNDYIEEYLDAIYDGLYW